MNDSTALVTGANKGIGKEIARLLVAEGFTVYVGSRDAGRGERAVAELGAAHGRWSSTSRTRTASRRRHGRWTPWTSWSTTRGSWLSGDPAPEADLDDFRRTYETNVFGVLAVTNAFLPALRRSPHPRIVNVSSGTGSLTWSADPDREFALHAARAPRTARPSRPSTP